MWKWIKKIFIKERHFVPLPETHEGFDPTALVTPEVYQNLYRITEGHKENPKTRELAYLKWEEAGKPEGKAEHFWSEAEKELWYEKYGTTKEELEEMDRAWADKKNCVVGDLYL